MGGNSYHSKMERKRGGSDKTETEIGDESLAREEIFEEILMEGEQGQNHSLLEEEEEQYGDGDGPSKNSALIDGQVLFISGNSNNDHNGKDNSRPSGANRVIRDRLKDNNNRNSFWEGEQPTEAVAADGVRDRQVSSKGESTFANNHNNVNPLKSQRQITIHLPNTNFNESSNNNDHQRDDDSQAAAVADDSNSRVDESNSGGDGAVANSQSQAKRILLDDRHQNDDQFRQFTNSPTTTTVRQNFNNHHHPSTKATGMSVRCHCNLASCVTNNYMCKSERRVTEDGKVLEAGCFVQELESESSTTAPASSRSSSQSSQHGASVPVWNGRVATARRGCVEFLTREKQEQCSDKAGNPVQCCTQDMCNYPKSFYPSAIQQNLNNNRLSFDSSSSGGGIRGGGGTAGMMPNLDHQVWLRAAVIAVPICGLMILVVLIIVARRLLQSDEDYKDPERRRSRRKVSSPPYYYRQQPSQQQQQQQHLCHPQQHLPHLPPIHESQRGLSYDSDSSFHVKPVYMETSECLLPQGEHYCSLCQHSDSPCSISQHSRSTSSLSHHPNS